MCTTTHARARACTCICRLDVSTDGQTLFFSDSSTNYIRRLALLDAQVIKLYAPRPMAHTRTHARTHARTHVYSIQCLSIFTQAKALSTNACARVMHTGDDDRRDGIRRIHRWARTQGTLIVMAYIVMAYIVMAYSGVLGWAWTQGTACHAWTHICMQA